MTEADGEDLGVTYKVNIYESNARNGHSDAYTAHRFTSILVVEEHQNVQGSS